MNTFCKTQTKKTAAVMAKTIGLKALAQKKYELIEGLPPEFTASFGELESAFDAIFYGQSNNGKSSLIAEFIAEIMLALKCKCEYIAYEEAHGRTIQATMIDRYRLHERLGNVLQITDHYTFDELDKRMARRQSAKIFVIDSLQAARFTAEQIADLKRKYVTSKKKKILIIISWCEGKNPQGAAAKAVEYMANIKVLVDKLIAFPKSRYGGGEPYVIHKETAIKRWGEKEFYKILGIKKPKTLKEKKQPLAPEPVTKMQLLPLETEEEKQEAMLKKLKEN